MVKIRIILLLSCTGIVCLTNCFSQEVKPYNRNAALNVNSYIKDYSTLPIRPARTLFFTTDEASRIHCDISPDGNTLLFTILGDIYLLSSKGGVATQISRGVSVNSAPTWSPDGKYIAFISDATGSPHIHIRNVEGTFHKVLNDHLPIRVSDTSTQEYSWREDLKPREWEPQWLPYGHCIVSNGQVFDLAGNVVNLPINFYHYTAKPILGFSAEGSKMITAGNISRTNKEATVFTIDLKSGDTTNTTKLSVAIGDKLFNCRVSPDGKWLCFIKNGLDKGNNGIFIANLATGQIRLIKSFAEDDTLVVNKTDRYAFSPDGKYVYIGYAGKLHRLDVNGNEDKIIPFTAKVEVDMGSSKLHQFKVAANGLQPIRLIRNAHRSDDGRILVFSALKKIYMMSTLSGEIKTVAEGSGFFYKPVISPNGRYIAFACRNATDSTGMVYIVDKEGKDSTRNIALKKGVYLSICWSPDGNSIAALIRASEYDGAGALCVINCRSGIAVTIKQIPSLSPDEFVSFSTDGEKIFYSCRNELRSVLNQPGFREECIAKMGTDANNRGYDWSAFNENQFRISPNGRNLIFSNNRDLFLIPILNMGESIIPNSNGSAIVRFAVGALDPHWEQEGKVISWSFGNNYFHTTLDEVLKAAQNSKVVEDSLSVLPFKIIEAKPKITRLHVNLKYPIYHEQRVFALTNAKIVTMEGNEVIPSGTIVIEDGIIKAVGNSSKVLVPKKAKVIDLNGKTIIPGMIDLHLHTYRMREVRVEEISNLKAFFANGVTTSLDPSSSTDMFAFQDIAEAGLTKGPRYYSVGKSVGPGYGAPLANLNEARNEVRKRAELGAITIKQYQQQTRLQQQWLLMACNEYGVNMTNEGANLFEEFLGQIKNGTPKIEHLVGSLGSVFTGVKKDIVFLYKASGAYVTATNNVNVLLNEDYFTANYPDTSAKLKKLFPEGYSEVKNSLQSLKTIPADYSKLTQRECFNYRIFRGGANIALGSHGDIPGPGLFYEMWAKTIGGYTNLEALKAATIVGAEGLGLDKYLGSIKPGKIADLLILNKDPLHDIHFNNDILSVMKNGVMYDPNTLDEVWPEKKK